MIKVCHMPWGRPGAKVLKEWEEAFTVGDGVAEGVAYWVKFKNPSGAVMSMIKYVKWSKTWEGLYYRPK